MLVGPVDPLNGVFIMEYRETMQWFGFDLNTGDQIWGPTDPENAWNYYSGTSGALTSNTVANGHLYTCGYGGVLYCYDTATGNLLWTYGNGGPGNSTDSGLEYPGRFPTFVKAIGGRNLNEGGIYTFYTEHTFTTPISKGALTRALNASDGTEIYTFKSATGEFGAGSFAIADGYTNFFNSYDSRIYTLGRGPSQTTVTVGPKSSTLGGTVIIEGTVMDVSVGLGTTEIEGRFPAGVPACSDSSMKDWMAYVHQQQLLPSDFKGVDVGISVVDANGNYRDLGTVTTDSKATTTLSGTPRHIRLPYNVIAASAQ
jgi:outer membrane protein assembly factor BamB